MKKAIIFARVSSTSDRQDNERQILDLKKYCEKNNLQVAKIIAEKISGAKSNEEREGIRELLESAKNHKFDVVVVSEISRLGRKPYEVQKTIEAMCSLGISIHIESLNLKTLDDNGNRSYMTDFFLCVLTQFASIELETLKSRIRSGLRKAVENGKKLGRRKGSVLGSDDLLRKYRGVVGDVRRNLSLRKIAKIHGVSVNTVVKVKRVMG